MSEPRTARDDHRTAARPMKKEYVIKILFVESSLEEAEQIISLLRNSGIAVRPARATNVEQMQAAVNELEPDLVMFDPAVTTIGSIVGCGEQAARQKRDRAHKAVRIALEGDDQ